MGVISLLRSLAGFAFPLFGTVMYQSLGYGKGDTVLAAVAILVGCPAYVFLQVVKSSMLNCIQTVALLEVRQSDQDAE